MAKVFGEAGERRLGDAYLDRLLSRDDFWATAAFAGKDIIGGLTAHTLPMTTSESAEIFIYDLAVREDRQRLGVGRALVATLRQAASAQGIHEVFVPADEEDVHALEFYRALGGVASPVTLYSWSDSRGKDQGVSNAPSASID